MEGSVGTALRTARLQRKLTVEEAARATKIRAARIVDLENDEYDRFPNLAYARSFLLLYAKFLGVDISKYGTMEVGSPAGVGDYQYLQNEGGVDSLRFTRQRPVEAPVQNLRWLPVVVIFMAFLILGSLTYLFILKVKRLGPVVAQKHEAASQQALSAASPSVAPEATKPAPAVSPVPQLAPAESQMIPATEAGVPGANGTESPAPKATPIAPPPLRALPADGSLPPPVGEPEVRRAVPVTVPPLQPGQSSPVPSAATPAPPRSGSEDGTSGD